MKFRSKPVDQSPINGQPNVNTIIAKEEDQGRPDRGGSSHTLHAPHAQGAEEQEGNRDRVRHDVAGSGTVRQAPVGGERGMNCPQSSGDIKGGYVLR